MRVTELGLSAAAQATLQQAGLHETEELVTQPTRELIQRPEFKRGVELHEIACALHRHGLTFSRAGGHTLTRRELEMFQLRTVEGRTLQEIAERFSLHRSRVFQLLNLHFGLTGIPPAAHRRRQSRRRA